MPGVVKQRRLIRQWVACVLLLTGLSAAQADSPTLHSEWDALLGSHVHAVNNGHSTTVDYAGMQRDNARLQRYLTRLEQVTQAQFDDWSPDRQLAFLINAYNAHTVALILTAYPDVDSIRELGGWFSSPWDKDIAPLLGDTRSLDDIEHRLIRGQYNEPRIHFAVNCASIGCPPLRNEAYTGPLLDAQLDDQTRRFLSDRSRNRLRNNRLQLSKIFDWYGGDFARGWRDTNSLQDFLLRYHAALALTKSQQQALRDGDIDIDYLPYNWDLNDVP